MNVLLISKIFLTFLMLLHKIVQFPVLERAELSLEVTPWASLGRLGSKVSRFGRKRH